MPTDPALISLKQLEAMRAGARVAARTCMGIGPVDRVFILTDWPTHGIGRLLAEEASEAGGEVLVRDLEQYAERPVAAVPEQLRSELLKFRPTVTFYAASTQPGEVTFRLQSGGAGAARRVTKATVFAIKDRDGALTAEVINTADDPTRIATAERPASLTGSEFKHTFDPLSVTLLELELGE